MWGLSLERRRRRRLSQVLRKQWRYESFTKNKAAAANKSRGLIMNSFKIDYASIPQMQRSWRPPANDVASQTLTISKAKSADSDHAGPGEKSEDEGVVASPRGSGRARFQVPTQRATHAAGTRLAAHSLAVAGTAQHDAPFPRRPSPRLRRQGESAIGVIHRFSSAVGPQNRAPRGPVRGAICLMRSL